MTNIATFRFGDCNFFLTTVRRFLNAAQYPPQGMHDVHMNQGDPPGQFQHLDGIWQDGGVLVERPNGNLAGFFVKFVTQTLNTNDQGLPA